LTDPGRTRNGLICDLDMTLVDSRVDIAAGLAHMITKLTGKTHTTEDLLPWIERGLAKTSAKFMPGLELRSKEFLKVAAIYQEHYKIHCADNSTVYPGVVETLTAIKAKGIRMAVATNKWGAMGAHVLKMHGLRDFFDHVQGTRVHDGKPEPTIILAACEAIGVSPGETVVIGDKTTDVLAGKAAGCETGAVTYGVHDRATLETESPDFIFDRFDELAALYGV
jgi:phosphoglycolate phosphatase